jgi:hypothetical protein
MTPVLVWPDKTYIVVMRGIAERRGASSREFQGTQGNSNRAGLRPLGYGLAPGLPTVPPQPNAADRGGTFRREFMIRVRRRRRSALLSATPSLKPSTLPATGIDLPDIRTQTNSLVRRIPKARRHAGGERRPPRGGNCARRQLPGRGYSWPSPMTMAARWSRKRRGWSSRR